MKIPKATVTAVLYKSKTLASGEHPVMIRVCYNSKRRYKSTGLSCPAKWWNAAKQEVRERHPLAPNMNAIIGSELTALKNKVLDFERQGVPYSVQQHIRSLGRKPPSRKTLYDLFEERIAYFRDTLQKHNSATGYQTLSISSNGSRSTGPSSCSTWTAHGSASSRSTSMRIMPIRASNGFSAP